MQKYESAAAAAPECQLLILVGSELDVPIYIDVCMSDHCYIHANFSFEVNLVMYIY